MKIYKTGIDHKNWKGGITKRGKYLYIYMPFHPHAIEGRYILFHRYKIEMQEKRILKTNEHIHHIDGNPLNNELDNLKLLSRKEHYSLHWKLNNPVFNKNYIPNKRNELGRFTKK